MAILKENYEDKLMIERIRSTATYTACIIRPGFIIPDIETNIRKVLNKISDTEKCPEFISHGEYCLTHKIERKILRDELEALNYLLKSKLN